MFITSSNLINLNRASANVATEANKTIVSHLIKNEFNTISEDDTLIEESGNLRQMLAAGKEKYNGLRAIINRPWISDDSEENTDETYANGALINALSLNPGETNDNNNNPSLASASRSEIIYYTVDQGDTISSIANKFKISVNTILWSNNLTAFSLIRPGDKLSILPVSGAVYTVKSGDTVGKIALKFGVEENSIFQYNNIKSANGLVIGRTIVIPGGRKISETVAIKKINTNKTSNAVAVIEKLINPKKAPASNTSMAWPTEGHRISQYYSWRHTGLDIANKVGTPLYAAEAGTVEFAGWSNGYGNNILINHGGGKKTRYAHASKLFVKVGEEVDRGEQIAAMGSTGWSTGPHIHFEVMVNGVKYNPLSYIR